MPDEPHQTLAQILEDEGIDPARLREMLDLVHPVDIAEMLEDLDVEDRVRVLETLEPERAAKVVVAVPHEARVAIVDHAGEVRLAKVIEKLPADALADIIDHLPAHKEKALMARLENEHREDVTALRQYKPHTAGGLMTKNYVEVPENFSAGETLRTIQGAVNAETISNIYVVDADERLVGVCGLGALMIHTPETPVTDFMRREIHFVGTELDQEEVARIARRYKLKGVPVVDNSMKLVGVVTLRDILDIIHEEANEDVMSVAGAGSVHPVTSGVWARVRGRLPWLGAAMVIELGLAWIMKGYERTLTQIAALTFFVPIIMAMGGNVGLQSSTTVVRGIATGDITAGKAMRVVLMESRSGAVLGVLCGIVTGFMSWIMNHSEILAAKIAGIVTISMVTSVSIASTLGAIIPFLLHRMKRDPAVASGPFITAMNDMLNVTIYLTLATLFFIKSKP